ncbi:MAG: hypothetical protein CMF96_06120 [Candidatus Marinimicrobia bacterium]|nr:hypothetical protein [Candidatus Neomarinimicrobiota bacterium]
MKKIVLLTLSIIQFLFPAYEVVKLQGADLNNENIKVNFSNINTTKLTIELDDFNIFNVDGEKGKIIHLSNGSQILKKGAPDLPKLTASIIIPDDQKMEINVTNFKYTEYSNYEILPSKGNLSRLVNPDNILFEYGSDYLIDEFYPRNLVELGKPYIIKDIRGIPVNTYPIQYNPISKILRVYNIIEVEIKSNGLDTENILIRDNIPKRSFEFENIYDSHFLNNHNDTRFDYILEHGNMLVICNEAFLPTMEPFVQWKKYKGIPIEIVGVNEAGGSAEAIKNYIADYYYSNGLTFVLLVGDEGQLPSVYVNGSASDPSFSFISGNDSYSDIIVGRFSGQNPSQIETQVERSINYERYPTSGNWYQKALGIASQEGPGMNGYTDDDFNDWLWSSVLSQYSYNQYSGIYDSNGGNVTQGINAVNGGAGIVNYTGHGSITSWGNGAPLNTSNVNSLTNNGQLPFVITVGCNVGEFQSTNECFSEAWQRSTNNGQPTGAIANMGSTIPQSWVPPMHGQWAMNKILTESFDGVSANSTMLTRTLGGIAINGCLHMNDAQGTSGTNESTFWTFFGDPTINIRTLAPTNLNADYESTIIIGQENFIISTGSQGDLVALSRNGELLASGYTNSDGTASLDILNVSSIPGEVNLVISSYNKYIYENELMVISPEGAYLIMDNYSTNGEVLYGSSLGLSLQFSNVGLNPANYIELELFSDNQFVNINNSNFELGSILNNQTIIFSEIELNISPNIPDGYQIQFTYNLNSGDDVWSGEFALTASAPQLKVKDIFIDANCGTLMPGGDGTVTVSIENVGSTPLLNPVIEVNTNGNVEIQNFYSDNLSSLFGSELLNISFDINIPIGIQLGSNLNPQISVSSIDFEDYFNALNFDLFLGELIENFETGDFSCHNWNNSDINSWIITSNSSSEGDYSAVSAQIDDSQSSSLSISMDVLNDGILEFDYRVSAEYSISGNYFFDGLEFYIDGSLMNQFQTNQDGTSPWNNVQYEVSQGQHDFVWTFIKDTGGGSTDCLSTNCIDAAFIDNLKFPFSEPEGLNGDINNDGSINVLDVVQTVSIVLNQGYNSFADVNNDGAINVLDIVQIVNLILEQ